VCLELQCEPFHCSYDFRRLGREGGLIIVVSSSSSSQIRHSKFDQR
jgi:hypothetical protein